MTITYAFGNAQPDKPLLQERSEERSLGDDRRSRMALYIGEFWQSHRYGPTLREIQSELAIKSLAPTWRISPAVGSSLTSRTSHGPWSRLIHCWHRSNGLY